MSSDWDEIKRLAADFQKVQLSSTLQKLSERNCIEIVSLLIEKGLVDVIYTNDGKEYLTLSQLETEITDELYVLGGRVNLVDLSKTLNVDLSKIENVAEKIVKENDQICFLLGQLIDENYLTKLASEINEKLSQAGEISVSDLTVQYNLPSDFILTKVMEKYLGTIIYGKQDPKDDRFFFTSTYMSRCKAKLRGALIGITRPTPVSAILTQCGLKERLFYSLFDEVHAAGSLTSKSPGAQYIPHVYTKTQNEWTNNIYKREGYLEYESIRELGISDPKSFIQRQFPNEKLTFLKKCALGNRIIDQVESEIDECIATGKFIDISNVVPTVISDEDIELLLENILNPTKLKSIERFDTKILTNQYLNEIIKPCYDIIDENAKKSIESGKYQKYLAEKQMLSGRNQDFDSSIGDTKLDKREERRKKAGTGKAGGGTQGRETKTKSTKKHYRGGKKDVESDSEDEHQNNTKQKSNDTSLELITIKEIIKVINEQLEKDELEDLTKRIAQHFYPQLSKIAMQKAQTLYEENMQNNNQSRRQTHAAVQEKLNVLLSDVRLYEKGLKMLSTDIQSQLVKYLLKSLGGDISNEIFLYVANECGLNFNEVQTVEQRNKITQDCAPEYKSSLVQLNKTISGTSIEEFLLSAENALQACSMIVKKIDKKKDRTIIHSHKLGLLDQLNQCSDPALVFHLAVLIIFTSATQNMIHASGRHVSAILTYLNPVLGDDQSKTLREYHDLVLKILTPENEDVNEITKKINDLIPTVKEIAKNFKKSGVTNVE